jgi:hypothetical protein
MTILLPTMGAQIAPIFCDKIVKNVVILSYDIYYSIVKTRP